MSDTGNDLQASLLTHLGGQGRIERYNVDGTSSWYPVARYGFSPFELKVVGEVEPNAETGEWKPVAFTDHGEDMPDYIILMVIDRRTGFGRSYPISAYADQETQHLIPGYQCWLGDDPEASSEMIVDSYDLKGAIEMILDRLAIPTEDRVRS